MKSNKTFRCSKVFFLTNYVSLDENKPQDIMILSEHSGLNKGLNEVSLLDFLIIQKLS